MKLYIQHALFCLLFSIGILAKAQNLSDTTSAKVDKLFSKWENEDKPGCVVGVIADDKLIYQKGFGLAQIESEQKNTPESIYYMCSVSKQFTGYAIALLAADGKLNLEEDIHTYLPWLTDFDHQRITVNNLLHHTSGIRDDITLNRFFSPGPDGILTQQKALEIIAKQRTLNFSPGEKFSYSNSNYILLAEIIEKISGKTFQAFVDSVIFTPLRMQSSAFIADYNAPIPGRANSYTAGTDGYHNLPQDVYTMGDGGLFTNLKDMARWIPTFYSQDSTRAKAIELMTTPGKLNNGRQLNYAMGINVNTDRGVRYLTHNGGLAGYRTIMAVYPEQKTGFLIFGNGSDGEVYAKIAALAEIFIPQSAYKNIQPANVPAPKEMVITDTLHLIKFSGTYIADNGYQVQITYKNKGLYLNGSQPMALDSAANLYLKARPAVRYRFRTNNRGEIQQTELSSPALAAPIIMEKIITGDTNQSEMKQYCGRYHCNELSYTIIVEQKNNSLWIQDQNKAFEINLLGNKHLFTPIDYLAHFKVLRGKKMQITGLELNSGELSNLVFKKVP